MRCASSATVMVSPICTSRLTGAAGRSKPCCVETLTCTGRRDLDAWCCFFFLKRALASLDTCSSARCARAGSPLGLAHLRGLRGLRFAATLRFLTLAGLGLATRLFFGGHARFFVSATLRLFFQLLALPRLGLALLRLQALLLDPILFLLSRERSPSCFWRSTSCLCRSTSSCCTRACSSSTLRLRYVFLLRTSTLTMRARPCAEATLISPCDLRCSVILRGAAASCVRPCARRRNVSSSILASSLMVSSAPETRMPASSSCVSRRSTGTFSTSANWLTVTSAMNPPAPLKIHQCARALRPVGPLPTRTSACAPP